MAYFPRIREVSIDLRHSKEKFYDRLMRNPDSEEYHNFEK